MFFGVKFIYVISCYFYLYSFLVIMLSSLSLMSGEISIFMTPSWKMICLRQKLRKLCYVTFQLDLGLIVFTSNVILFVFI